MTTINDTKNQVGYFLLSFDTELAWGYFDKDKARSRLFSPDGSRERRAIERILDILDVFGISATWAVVGHLFFPQCEECDICPILRWQGKYRSFEEVYQTDSALWYGADIVEAVLSRRTKHEIAFHGYTHEVFDEDKMTREEAEIEIREWRRVSKRKGILPRTAIFPRDRVGYLDLFREAGFIGYRSDVVLPKLYRPRYIGPLLKSLDHILSLSTPPVYRLDTEPSGMVNLRSSQHFFGFNRGLEMLLDSIGLHRLRIGRMIKGVKKAIEERAFTHIWAHPWEFRTEKDFEKLCYLLGHVSEEIAKGRIQSVCMADLAEQAILQSKIVNTGN